MNISKLLFVRKIKSLTKETLYLIKKEKAYFIAPIVIFLLFLAAFIYHVGPAVILTFIYAGV